MDANERQVGGSHYKSETQHWDLVVEHRWDYFQAQIIKYMMRWKKKGGVEDLKKAQHFLQKYIEIHDDFLPVPIRETNGLPTKSSLSDMFIYIGYQNGVEILECKACRQAIQGANVTLMEIQHTRECPAQPGRGYVDQG